MRRKSRFKITVSDETRLHDLGSFRLSGWKLAALVAGLVAAALFFGALVVMLTPLRMMLPGYLGRDERVKAEMAILRLDSISEAESRTRAFLDNILTVTNTDRVPTDSLTARGGRMKGRADSLMDASAAERKFVEMMRDREKFNISVLAPLAADGMMFYPLSEEGIITTQSLEEPRAVFVVPVSSPLCAIADGTVITVSRLANDSYDVQGLGTDAAGASQNGYFFLFHVLVRFCHHPILPHKNLTGPSVLRKASRVPPEYGFRSSHIARGRAVLRYATSRG